MRIVKLVAENVKRLHAVSITPDGTLVTIGGKNGAGKSSVLDSIAYAMGGEKLVPSEPIRAGESEAKVVVDLGDLVVTRKFKRMPLPCDCEGGEQGEGLVSIPHEASCASHKFGETTSTLTVTNKDGAKYPSPQAVLDQLLGKLTFDPLEFAALSRTADGRKQQDAILRRLVNLDVSGIEARRKEAFERRAMFKKTHAIKQAQLDALPMYKDVPTSEVSMEAVSAEMLRAEEMRAAAEQAEREVEGRKNVVSTLNADRSKVAGRIAETNERIKELQALLDKLDSEQAALDMMIDEGKAAIEAAQTAATAARAAVPDAEVIRAKLKEVEETNVKVRANQKASAMQAEVEGLIRDVEAERQTIVVAEEEKKAALAAARFPVDGLGLSDDGVLFNGLPFDQACSSEQVRVSVAIGIALNPQLKVLLVRNGNMLDKDSVAAVAAQAEAAGMQVWMEFVSEEKDGMSVMMVDGEVQR